ncbi:MAG: hypothetical protein WA802_03725 [Terracidiphilus sp.]
MTQMRTFRHSASFLFVPALLIAVSAAAQQPERMPSLDSDQDGMSDALEQALLVQFAPRFLVDPHDCSKLPAEFTPNLQTPTVKAEDGTIYGQVLPATRSIEELPTAEIHFYHLWRTDCGPHGHPLDSEHVAVLVTASERDLTAAKWKARYWFAAAHEDTVCDVSQITRASTIHAEESGATVFVSPGKHASYLNQKLCRAGCGADKCVNLVSLPPGKIINLGEAAHPMNGSIFVASAAWPLLGKMTRTDFPPEPLVRLSQMPVTDIAWFNPGRHPAQGIIATSSTTGQAIAVGAGDTTSSLAKAGVAISVAQDNTGSALQRTYKNTKHALGVSVKHVGKAMNPQQESEKP